MTAPTPDDTERLTVTFSYDSSPGKVTVDYASSPPQVTVQIGDGKRIPLEEYMANQIAVESQNSGELDSDPPMILKRPPPS